MNQSSLAITALAIGLLATGCSQASGPKDEAESYAMKACDIKVSTSDSGDTEKYVYTDTDGTTWSIEDSLTDLEERETALQDLAQNAAQANRLDPYWDGLAEARQEMYSYVNRIVQARKEFNVYLGWNGKDWPQRTIYRDGPEPSPPLRAYQRQMIPIGKEDVSSESFIKMYPWAGNAEDYNNPLSITQVTCGSLADSLNTD
jgi:hypothetical protein